MNKKNVRSRVMSGLAICLFAVLMLSMLVSAGETKKKYDIRTVPGDYAIQADVTLSGSGSGFHAKLLVCTATAATSFGIQFDKHAAAPYTGKAAYMYENILSNRAGGQKYGWYGKSALKKKCRLMLAFTKKTGKVTFYVNGRKVGSVKNKNLKNKQVYLRVEASARKKGDKVRAVFRNIRLKRAGKYDGKYPWKLRVFDTNKKMKSNISKYASSKLIIIAGKIAKISGDWDSNYGSVSGIVQFNE